MKKLKVMTVLGTRPEIIRLSRVIAVLDRFTDHVLVHTGQNYDFELNEIFFSEIILFRDGLVSLFGAIPSAFFVRENNDRRTDFVGQVSEELEVPTSKSVHGFVRALGKVAALPLVAFMVMQAY